MKRQLFFSLLTIIFISVFISVSMAAEKYPSRPVNILTWGKPGSALDISGRQLSNYMSKRLGQPFVVANKPGAGGSLATTALYKTPADGYNLLLITRSFTEFINTTKLPYNEKDFEYLAHLVYSPFAIGVNKNSNIKSIDDFVNRLKKDSGSFQIGGTWAGSLHVVVANNFFKMAGINPVWVPHEGSSEAVIACVGGHVEAVWGTMGSLLPHEKTGNLRILVTTSKKRLAGSPDVPTFMEKGYNVTDAQWTGMITKKGISKEIAKTIIDALEKAVETDEWVKYNESYSNVTDFIPGEEFMNLVNEQSAEVRERSKK